MASVVEVTFKGNRREYYSSELPAIDLSEYVIVEADYDVDGVVSAYLIDVTAPVIPPVALNAGNWLYFWPQVLLSRMALPGNARLERHAVDRALECRVVPT